MNDPPYIHRIKEFNLKEHPHKYTSEQYYQLRRSLKERLRLINDQTTSFVHGVKKIALDIDLTNIKNAIDYFFNDKTYKPMDYHLNLFTEGIKRIKQLLNGLTLTNIRVKMNLEEYIKELLSVEMEMKEQYLYIQQLENQIYTAKKEFYKVNQ